MTVSFTILALLAFAANSLLCRLALRGGAIDPASFTVVRLVAGAVMLVVVGMIKTHRTHRTRRTHRTDKTHRTRRTLRTEALLPALMLFVYAAGFSFAYVGVSAGTGALILFGAVQVTMLVVAMARGERLGLIQWAGLAAAVGGITWMVLPGLEAPSPISGALMVTAGAAWGLYSVHGRGSPDPLGQTRRNFILTLPLAAVLGLAWLPRLQASRTGLLLAVISGAVTSGLGYVIWYRALRGLSGVAAALVQLATPVLAAIGGILFLSEPLGSRLVISTLLVLGGIGVAILSKERAAPSGLNAAR